MHIPPGQWYVQKDMQFWKPDSTEDYLEVFTKYHDRILMLLGAHVHMGEIRAPKFKDQVNLSLMMTPSIAPIFANNPGYSILEVSNDGKIDITWKYF
jgi:predicted glycosyl hydrolase (DUF1957 family)